MFFSDKVSRRVLIAHDVVIYPTRNEGASWPAYAPGAPRPMMIKRRDTI